MEIVDHEQANQLFSSYWEKDLPAETAAALREHMGSCLVCRREYAEFERTMSAVGSLGREVAPPDFVAGVARRVHKRSRGRFFDAGGAARRTDRVPYELFSLVMLALLLGVYIVVQLAQPGRLNVP